MLRFEWSKAVKRPSLVVLRARRRGPRSPWTRFVPPLDPMEDRTLLSTLTVLNNADSGSGSLRAEIAAASSGDTIVFAPKLQGGQTITLASELDITKNLDIEGPASGRLTISGGGVRRVFEIGSGATVTLANLTIADGQTSSTGTSGDALGGGGILNDAGATLNLTRCSVVNNKATAGPNLDVFGGGLLNLGVAYVTSSTFTGNQVLGGTGPRSLSEYLLVLSHGRWLSLGFGLFGLGPTLCAHCPPQSSPTLQERRQIFKRLWVKQISCHSADTFSRPRNRNLRIPRADLIMPNTGSTMCLCAA